MTWFSGDVKHERGTIPGARDVSHDMLSSWPVADPTATDSSNRGVRRVRRNAVLEPNSVTDARARVDNQISAFSRPRSARRALLGISSALFIGDAVALSAQMLIVIPHSLNPLLFSMLLLISRAATRQYRPRMFLAALDDIPRSIGSVLAAVGLALVAESVAGNGSGEGTELLQRAGLFLAMSLVIQAGIFAAARRVRRARRSGRRTLVVGEGRVGSMITLALLEHPELGLAPIGVAGPDMRTSPGYGSLPVLVSDMSRLARAIVENEIDTTILALKDEGDAHVDTVITLHQTGCTILMVPSMFELHHDGPDIERVRGVPLLRLRPDPTLRLSWWIKRGLDVVAGALGLLLLSLPLAVVALAILVTDGRPVLFWQDRVGLDGRTFRLCKFRSMRPDSEVESQTTWNIGNDPRVNRVGRFLRRSSIDEIPQLWNIVRGQMSVVGPRPERPGFVVQFSKEHERYWARHRVPVGLTGMAQVNGLRGDTSILERARYDNYYIANWSLWLDVKIMLLTVREVIGGRGR